MEKRCSRCKEPKTVHEFTKNKAKSDGLQSICRACRKIIDALRVSDGSNKRRCRIKQARMNASPKEILRKTQWRIANKTLHNFINRRHYQQNKLQYFLRTHVYRSRLAQAQGSFTMNDVAARFAIYGNRCAYCGIQDNLTIDHVISLKHGGSNWPSNLVPCCFSCNSAKRERFWKPHFFY